VWGSKGLVVSAAPVSAVEAYSYEVRHVKTSRGVSVFRRLLRGQDVSCYEVLRRLFRALGLNRVAERNKWKHWCECSDILLVATLGQTREATLKANKRGHSHLLIFSSFSAMHGLVKSEKSRVEKLVTVAGERRLQ